MYAQMYTCIYTHTCTHTHTHTHTADEDFEAVTTTLSFGRDSQQIITITILDDNQIESSETILLELQIAEELSGNIQLIPDVAQVLIQDNDSKSVHSNSCSCAGLFMLEVATVLKCSYMQDVL